MSEKSWEAVTGRMGELLAALSFRDAAGAELGADEGFERWRRATLKVRKERHTVYLVGNGASASMASHLAADLAKNARMHTQVFSDLSLVTAISNDMGFEHVFSEPLRRRGRADDMLVAISSSGKSPNILAVIDAAREIGMTIVTLSAMSADNPSRPRGELNAYVPAQTYSNAEACHACILHHWMDLMEESSRPRK